MAIFNHYTRKYRKRLVIRPRLQLTVFNEKDSLIYFYMVFFPQSRLLAGFYVDKLVTDHRKLDIMKPTWHKNKHTTPLTVWRPLARKSTENQRQGTSQNSIIGSDNYRLKYSIKWITDYKFRLNFPFISALCSVYCLCDLLQGSNLPIHNISHC